LPLPEETIMTEISSSTALDRPITAWLAHQRALGREYGNEERVLDSLRRSIARHRAADLDQVGFDLWCDTLRHLDANTRRARQRIARKFCLYRQRTEPMCYVPNPLYFARPHPGRSPIIVEPEQAARMLAETAGLTPTANSPLLPAVMRLAIVILYTAGLRRGELLRLTLDDVEPRAGVLRIRSSKFHKSRLVPLSPDAGDELRAYLCKRLVPSLDASPHAPLLCNTRGGLRGYTGTGLSAGIHRLFKTTGVQNSEGRRPRIHDLRHSFAVQALVRWYREGADVQSNLPKLAMYMGHVSIVSTAYYLHFVPALAALAGDRFEKSFGDLIEETPA
jgi:integrase/recombinase XerD